MSEVNLSALTAEALNKSGVLWLRLPGGDRLTWFANGTDELEGQVLLVSGGPEEDLGPVPERVELVLRSKGNGGRLLTLHARAQVVDPDDPQWPLAATALVGVRLNAPAGRREAWRTGSTIWRLAPFGAPLQSPGSSGELGSERVAAPVTAGSAGTRVRRPWHLGGRSPRRG